MMPLCQRKLRFGVLSTANIGLKKVIPAMQQGEHTTVAAIASRDLAKAREAAKALDIPTAYGSYEELLADPEHRRDLQSASQSAARSVDHQGRRSRQARALRKTAQHDRGRSQNAARRARPHRRQNLRSLHDPQFSSMAAPAPASRRRPRRRAARGQCAFQLLQHQSRQHSQPR